MTEDLWSLDTTDPVKAVQEAHYRLGKAYDAGKTDEQHYWGGYRQALLDVMHDRKIGLSA